MANPEFAKAMSLQQHAALDNRYAALFKQLDLSPAELERFKNLLVERQNSRMDVINAARENGLNPRENRDEINKLVSEAQAEVDANIKAALGEARFNQYQNYDATQSQRNLVSQLDQRLSYSSTQLNTTQSQFLVTALASGNAPASEPPPRGPGNWDGGGNRTITAIGSATSILEGPVPGTLVSIFSIPPTFDATIDQAGNLPGPGAVALPGTASLCSSASPCPEP